MADVIEEPTAMEIVNDAPSTNGEEQPKTFQQRLSDIPTYTMTLSQLQTFYSSLKARNEVLKNAFETGEQYAVKIAAAAKPVVIAATNTAFKVAKPVVGEVSDPVTAIDTCASEVLAKVQEKAPFITQTPKEIAGQAKEKAQETTQYYLGKVTDSKIAQSANKQIENAVSLSELMVELVFPTDGNNPDDLKEIEKAEEDEDKGLIVRASNLKDKTVRRGTRSIMAYRPVKSAVDMVQYTQEKVAAMTETLKQGTNYVTSKSSEAKDTVSKTVPEVQKTAEEKLKDSKEYLKKHWDHIYSTTMYIPKKAIEVTGEVYISAQEIVFAYTKAHSVSEVPHAVAEMAESYYNSIKTEAPSVGELKEKAVGFVYVPAQVISQYIQSTRTVQWMLPKDVETPVVHVVESEQPPTEE